MTHRQSKFKQTQKNLIVLITSILSLPGALAAELGSQVKTVSQPLRILIVVTSHGTFDGTSEQTGYWLSEVAHFQQTVKAKGYQVDYVSPQGGNPPMDEKSRDLKDPLNQAFLRDAEGMSKLEHSLRPSEVTASSYAAIYYAGGHGPLWDLPVDAGIQKLAQDIDQKSGVVSAVCHGPAGLLNLKRADGTSLIQGKRVTGLTNLEETLSGKSGKVPYRLQDELKKRGARFDAGFPFFSHVVVDGRLVTGQNPNSTIAVAEAVLQVLGK